MRILFVVNPVAGLRNAPREAIATEMAAAGVEFEIVETEGKGHGTELAKGARARGWDMVAAVGGDGTMNEVGRGLMGSGVPLGVVPCGSGNALARFLRVPLKPARACKALAGADFRAFDVGRIGGEIFLSSAGIGLDAEVCARFNRRRANRRGLLRYVMASASAFAAFQPVEVALELGDGTTFRSRPTLLSIANTGHFGNGARIAPEALADDGKLDVCVVEPGGAISAVWHSRRLFTGSMDRMPGYRRYRTERCRIVCPAPPLFQIDGEDVQAQTATLDVSVEPRALKVAVPRA